MVYDTRDYVIFGLCPLPSILKNVAFRNLDVLPSLGDGVGDTIAAGSISKA
jgi:hypothetical protein